MPIPDKRVTIDDVVAEIHDGMTVGIGGWGSCRKPMALVRALCRSDVQDLTLVSYGGPDVGLLCRAGKVKHVVYAFVSLDSIVLEPHFRNARQAGVVEPPDSLQERHDEPIPSAVRHMAEDSTDENRRAGRLERAQIGPPAGFGLDDRLANSLGLRQERDNNSGWRRRDCHFCAEGMKLEMHLPSLRIGSCVKTSAELFGGGD